MYVLSQKWVCFKLHQIELYQAPILIIVWRDLSQSKTSIIVYIGCSIVYGKTIGGTHPNLCSVEIMEHFYTLKYCIL